MADTELIIEILCEEIPERFLAQVASGDDGRDLAAKTFDGLVAAGVFAPAETGGNATFAFTARRLAMRIQGTPLREQRLVGPPMRIAFDADGKPTKALEAFCSRQGIASVPADPASCATDGDAKNPKVVFTRTVERREFLDRTSEAVGAWLAGLNWPQKMTWGAGRGPFARPVRNLVALWKEDGRTEVLPVRAGEPGLFGVVATDVTLGHRIFGGGSTVAVAGWDGYLDGLRRAHVILDPAARVAAIRDGLVAAAKGAGGVWIEDDELVERVARQVEWPRVIRGEFPKDLLALPREVVVTVMREHQKFFCVEAHKAGELLPAFLNVIDGPVDDPSLILRANRGVLVSRLKDALFFWNEDLKKRLDEHAAALARVTYHRELGSYADKVTRIRKVAAHLAQSCGLAAQDAGALDRAAALCKADLVTNMIGEKEMTALQGVMGGFYAREQGEPDAVWRAVRDHYLPTSSGGDRPSTPLGQLLAVADKADTLAGMFGLGQMPTGSRDPFGLRRAILGILRIALEENGPDLDLEALFRAAIEAHHGLKLKRTPDEALGELLSFTRDRLEGLLPELFPVLERNEVRAVLAVGSTRPLDARRRALALNGVRRDDRDVFTALAGAVKRVRNILKGLDADGLRAGFDHGALQEAEERALWDAFRQRLAPLLAEAAGAREVIAATASLRPEVDRFFDKVLVNCDDPALRAARLGLLAHLEAAFRSVADLSVLQE